MAKFVGINSQPVTQADGTIIQPVATIEFTARTTPGGEYDRELAVTFTIDEFCQTRLTGGIDKNGNPAKLSWYSHWRIDDATGEVVYTRKDGTERENAGPSVASIYQLSHLEQQGLRESQAYIDAVNASDKFTDAQKAKLTSFSASHGSTRENGGTQTMAQKTEKVITTIADHGVAIIQSNLTPAEKAELADKIEKVATATVATCREPLAEQARIDAERQELETAVETTTADLANVLAKGMKATKEEMLTAMTAKEQALATLAEHNAKHAEPEQAQPAPEQEPAEPNAEQTEPTPEPTPETEPETEQVEPAA